MDTPVLRGEYNEYKSAVTGRFKRNDKRLENLEAAISDLNDLTAAVQKLAVNIEYLIQEQKEQHDEIETLKDKDGDMWRTSVKYVVTLVIGGVLGLAAKAVFSGLF